MEGPCWSGQPTTAKCCSILLSHERYTSSTGLLRTGWFPSVEIPSCVYLFPAVPTSLFTLYISPLSLSLTHTVNMSLRLATPVVRSTARALVRQQPMALVKIHSCEYNPHYEITLSTTTTCMRDSHCPIVDFTTFIDTHTLYNSCCY